MANIRTGSLVDDGDGPDAAIARQPHDLTQQSLLTAKNDAADDDSGINLLVAGLTRDVDDRELRRMFEPFGDVIRAIVMLKANTATSRGFGFVLFARQAEGLRALEALHGLPCGPNALSIKRSKHDGSVEEASSVFVRNIPKEIPVTELRKVFERVAGRVFNIKLVPGSCSQVVTATVELATVDEARRAITALHGALFSTLYEDTVGCPPLPPQAPGRSQIPPMLVKFAESDNSRTQRYIKTRQEKARRVAVPGDDNTDSTTITDDNNGGNGGNVASPPPAGRTSPASPPRRGGRSQGGHPQSFNHSPSQPAPQLAGQVYSGTQPVGFAPPPSPFMPNMFLPPVPPHQSLAAYGAFSGGFAAPFHGGGLYTTLPTMQGTFQGGAPPMMYPMPPSMMMQPMMGYLPPGVAPPQLLSYGPFPHPFNSHIIHPPVAYGGPFLPPAPAGP
jgi:hypothetical protein